MEQNSHPKSEYREAVAILRAAGVRYDGVQSGHPRGDLLQFTDPVTGTSMLMWPKDVTADSARIKIEARRAEFEKYKQPVKGIKGS